MAIDPKSRTLIQEQISIIQNKMMDRIIEQFKYLSGLTAFKEDYIKDDSNGFFEFLMKIYNDYNDALIRDIIIPLESPANQTPFHPVAFVQVVKRLNKGYARLVYDTTRERLMQLMEEEEAKKNLNDIEEETPTPTTEEDNTNTEGENQEP